MEFARCVQHCSIIGRSCLRIDVVCFPTTEPDSFFAKYLNVEKLSYKQIQCGLPVSEGVHIRFPHRVCGQNTRVFFATGTSTLLSWLWPFHDMELVPRALIGIIWAYCLVWFIIEDVVKVLAYASVNPTNFSFVGESAETKDSNKKLVHQASVRAQKGSVKASGQPMMNVLEGELQTCKKIAEEAK